MWLLIILGVCVSGICGQMQQWEAPVSNFQKCTFNIGNDYYDLTSLTAFEFAPTGANRNNYKWAEDISNYAGNTYFVNICANVILDTDLQFFGACKYPTPVCMTDTTTMGFELGNLDYQKAEPLPSGQKGVQITYPKGYFDCSEGTTEHTSTGRTAVIRITCDPTSKEKYAKILSVTQNPVNICQYIIEMTSKNACPTNQTVDIENPGTTVCNIAGKKWKLENPQHYDRTLEFSVDGTVRVITNVTTCDNCGSTNTGKYTFDQHTSTLSLHDMEITDCKQGNPCCSSESICALPVTAQNDTLIFDDACSYFQGESNPNFTFVLIPSDNVGGLSWWAWVLIGVGVAVLLAFLFFLGGIGGWYMYRSRQRSSFEQI